MRHTLLLTLAAALLNCAQAAAPLPAAPLLEVELRWVEQALPADPGALSTAGLPRGGGTLGTRPAQAGISPAGPVLRVQSGATAVWQLRQVPPLLLARTGAGDDRGTRLQLPLSDPATEWRLEASPTLLPKGEVNLGLSWQQPQDGGQAQWQTTLPLALGRWTVVARSPAPALAEPGTLRSNSSTAHPGRELQVRVNRVVSATE